MFNSIANYLEKFEKITPPERELRYATSKEVKESLGMEVNPEDISFKNGIIYIKAHPVIKSEVNLNKTSIIIGVSRRVGDKHNIQDIK